MCEKEMCDTDASSSDHSERTQMRHFCVHRRRTSGTNSIPKGCAYSSSMMYISSSYLFIVISAVIVIFSICIPSTTGSTSTEHQALDYFSKFGYMSGPSSETGNLVNKEDLHIAVRNFQKFANLPETGVLDQRTREKMTKPRCGNKDPIMDSEDGRNKRYVLAPSKWDRLHLTYRITNFTPDLPERVTRRAIKEAFAVWEEQTDLRFREVSSGDADIIILFARQYHQDGYPFDGQGLVLAHAFFPGVDKGGDTHFDDDELWTYNSEKDGVDLFMVAAHEFGHALGLSHSNKPGALMYPWYQGYVKDFKLPYDDVLGIQTLYGSRTGNIPPRPPPVTTTTTLSPQEPERPRIDGTINPCEHAFEAISVIRSEVFLFMGPHFWRLDSRGIIQGKPTAIHAFWYNFPQWVDHIDAVFERKTDGKILFFIGDKFWTYSGNNPIPGHPRDGVPLTELGLPADVKKVDAAFVWGFNNRTYIISGDMYWKLNERNDYIEPDYPRDMSIWRQVPVPLDTAFNYWDGKTYFFKGQYFYQFNDKKMKVQKGYPKLIQKYWLGCDTLAHQIKSPETSNTASLSAASMATLLLTLSICMWRS